MKKKILIVDGTSEFEANFAAAKNYFEVIGDYSFIFCTNRKEAEKKMSEASIVITDKRIPYSSKKLFNVNFRKTNIKGAVTVSGRLYDKNELSEVNGFYLLLKASSLGKTVILFSDFRGNLEFGKAQQGNNNKCFKISNSLAKNNCVSYEELLLRVENNPTPIDYYHLWLYASQGGINEKKYQSHEIIKLFKSDLMAWSIAWRELSDSKKTN